VWALADDDDDNEDGDNGEDDDDDDEPASRADDGAADKVYPTFEAFLAFLEAGCRGSAAQSYPLLVLLLSTLPVSVSASSCAKGGVVPHATDALRRCLSSAGLPSHRVVDQAASFGHLGGLRPTAAFGRRRSQGLLHGGA
jgi:hypothetical protein